MKVVIDIPDNEVPKTQEVVATYIHFIDGEVCELGNYGVMTLPKGHGDLIDRNHLEEMKEPFYSSGGDMIGYGVLMDSIRKCVKPIIPADKGEE